MNNALKTGVRSLLGTADVTELLLEKGAIVDFQDNDGDSALIIAASEGNILTIELL